MQPSRLLDVCWRVVMSQYTLSRSAAGTSGFMRRHPVIVVTSVGFITLLASALMYRERIAFVSPCMSNGHSFQDCSCTFEALPKLPPSYKPVVLAWAHQTTLAYGTETLVFGTVQVVETAKSEIGMETSQKKDPLAAKALVISSVQWAMKRLGFAATKVVAAPIATVVLLNKLTAEYAEARGVLGETCGGTLDRVLGSYHRLKVELDNRLKSLAEITKNNASETAKSAANSAAFVWNWIASKWRKN
jgi:hypothetical protein